MGLRSRTAHLLLLQEHHPVLPMGTCQPAPFHSREKCSICFLVDLEFSNQCSALIYPCILQSFPAPAPAPHSFPPAPSHPGSS